MGGPRPPIGGQPAPESTPYRQPRGEPHRNFGPNKPPKGRGSQNFSKNRNQEGKARGPLKERLSGRMFSVDEDARFQDEEDTGLDVDLNMKDDELKDDEE